MFIMCVFNFVETLRGGEIVFVGASPIRMDEPFQFREDSLWKLNFAFRIQPLDVEARVQRGSRLLPMSRSPQCSNFPKIESRVHFQPIFTFTVTIVINDTSAYLSLFPFLSLEYYLEISFPIVV